MSKSISNLQEDAFELRGIGGLTWFGLDLMMVENIVADRGSSKTLEKILSVAVGAVSSAFMVCAIVFFTQGALAQGLLTVLISASTALLG